MDKSRRHFLTKGAAVVGVGVVAACAPESSAQKPAAMVAACGISCTACPLMKAGKCKGCATGTGASPEMLKKKTCPVLQCAAKKKIEYCGTGCKMFTKCKKLIGQPYAKAYLEKIEKKL